MRTNRLVLGPRLVHDVEFDLRVKARLGLHFVPRVRFVDHHAVGSLPQGSALAAHDGQPEELMLFEWLVNLMTRSGTAKARFVFVGELVVGGREAGNQAVCLDVRLATSRSAEQAQSERQFGAVEIPVSV